MNRVTRRNLEEQGVIVAFCSALFLYFLWQMSEHIDSHQSAGFLHEIFAVFVLPVSSYFSALTVVRFVGRVTPAVGWWLRGLLRWAFWWVVRSAITASAGGIAASIAAEISGELLMKSTLAIPTIYLICQALRDYRAARQRFGSLAAAERAHWADHLKHS